MALSAVLLASASPSLPAQAQTAPKQISWKLQSTWPQANLLQGSIDPAEWAIPAHDILMGFQNITKFYYMPDMRQPRRRTSF